jgi:hypothetical protein
MGIKGALPHLYGGSKYYHSFEEAGLRGKVVPFDAAGALWSFAHRHAWDFLNGNHQPALIEWARLLNYLRSIMGWKLVVYFDGMENVHKQPEIDRRKKKVQQAKDKNDAGGQVKNTPEYIAKAYAVCKHLQIDVRISAYEADPQVSHHSMSQSLVAVTGDSDLLAYGVATKLVVVKTGGYTSDWFRIIDLDPPNITKGEYPLNDLYHKHGKIVLQLYAACAGCDFTDAESGIPGIGYKAFIESTDKVEEGKLSSATLAVQLWEDKQEVLEKDGYKTVDEVEEHLQRIVDVYSLGQIYDEKSNIVNMKGGKIKEATELSKRHMEGGVDSRTRGELRKEVRDWINNTNYAQLRLQTVAEASTIRGVNLPAGKTIDQCTVAELRDYIAARGGKIGLLRAELVVAAKHYQFLEKEVPKEYVHRQPDQKGSMYAAIETSSTRQVPDILNDLAAKANTWGAGDAERKGLIRDAHQLYQQGLFDDSYDNIARVAPELRDTFIIREAAHIGSSIKSKNIGDALARCWYDKTTTYHAVAFVPNAKKVIILSKCHASMATDDKARKNADKGEMAAKKEYLLMMELYYNETSEEQDGHALGIFTRMGRSYCTNCTAGQGACRHRSERLWFQYHHWTEERLGIDRPSTLGVCSWHPGGKALNSDVRQKIYEQQCVKHERTINDQVEKINRGVKRNCTEGVSCDYQIHYSRKKQRGVEGRFAWARVKHFFQVLRKIKK